MGIFPSVIYTNHFICLQNKYLIDNYSSSVSSMFFHNKDNVNYLINTIMHNIIRSAKKKLRPLAHHDAT